MSVNYAKLNHILIPPTKAGRDRFRQSRAAVFLAPIGWLAGALSTEGRVLFVASFVIGGFGVDVQSTQVYLLWAALVALLVGSVALRRWFRLPGVHLTVKAPRRVALGETIRFAVIVRNGGPTDVHTLRLRGPYLPWDGTWVSDPKSLPCVRRGETACAELAARFADRGEHHLDSFSASALVPLGLADGPEIASDGCKFIVVPKVAHVVSLRLPFGARHQPGGVALASKTGESMDLLGVRPYRAGDPVRNLHARSSARAAAPVVREYQEEYFSRVGVVVDAAVVEPRHLEAILSLAAGVVAHLSHGEALIDLLVVGDRVHDLTLGRHLGFLEQALDLLACVKMERHRIDPDALIGRLAPHLRRLSSVVVVAPAWDRGALADRIRGFGVGALVLIVEGATRGSAPAVGPDVSALAMEAVLRGEALAL